MVVISMLEWGTDGAARRPHDGYTQLDRKCSLAIMSLPERPLPRLGRTGPFAALIPKDNKEIPQ